jgi:hypothetical protein
MRQESAFIRLRRSSKNALMDTAGYWSYPALVQQPQGDLLWLFVILGVVPLPKKTRTALFRPKAVLLTKADSVAVVRYDNLRLGHDPFPTVPWDKPVAMFPHKSICELTQQRFAEMESEMLTAYTDVTKRLSDGAEIPGRFRDLYMQLQHPIFLGYVKCLAPDFFKAVVLPTLCAQTSAAT